MSEEDNKKWYERILTLLFSEQSKDWKGFVLVLSIVGNIYLTNLYIKQNANLNDKIVQEVRKQVPGAVTKEVQPLKDKVDTATQVVKDASSNIQDFIKKHD